MRRNHIQKAKNWQFFSCIFVGCLIYFCLLWQVLTLAANSTSAAPDWATPKAVTIKRVTEVNSAQSQPNLFDNMDCQLLSYRITGTNTMTNGCFVETALGYLDADTDIMIFNGSDEGLPLTAFSPHQVLAPWPRASALIALDTANTGGAYISLYRSPPRAIQDQRNLLLQLVGKKLIAPPDLSINDRAGQRLVINSQTMAFSDGGSWLVAEDYNGSFVRINLATLDIKAFAPSFVTSGSPGALKSRVAVSHDGRYIAIYNDAADSFRIYDLTSCTGNPINLQPETCASHDYQPFTKSQISGLQSVRHVRFINDNLLSFEANTSSPATSGIYELAPTDSITSLIDYLGLGDSYTSGEGAFDYLEGTDTANNSCHLSVNSYPLLISGDLFSQRGGHSVACSGAASRDIGNMGDSYRGQVKNVLDYQHLKDNNPALLNSVMTNFVPGYIAQQRFVNQYQPKNLTISVGGDDVGFGDILEACVTPKFSLHLSDNSCFGTFEDRQEILNLIDKSASKWTALYKQLKAASPETNLYAVGYPQIASDTGNCALNVHLSKSEIEFSIGLIDYFNLAFKNSSDKAGVYYVDVSQALSGHRMCETQSYNVAVNGLTAGTDAGAFGIKIFGKESYHPNALGQQLIEKAILKQTKNLTARVVVAGSNADKTKLLSVPKTGRLLANRLPASAMTSKVINKGKPAQVKVSGTSASLKPKTSYTVRLDGPAGSLIGTVISDDNGDIDSSIIMPTTVLPGGRTVDVTGENQSGEIVDITQPIIIPFSETDADGDGVSNENDSCPSAINSGVDIDHDGIDDTCDPLIGQSPASPTTTNSSAEASGSSSAGSTGSNVSNTANIESLAYAKPINAVHLKVSEPVSTASTVKSLGISTINPQVSNPLSTGIGKITAPTKKNSGSTGLRLAKVRSVNWVAWVVAACLLWLLLVLIGVYLDNLADRRTQSSY